MAIGTPTETQINRFGGIPRIAKLPRFAILEGASPGDFTTLTNTYVRTQAIDVREARSLHVECFVNGVTSGSLAEVSIVAMRSMADTEPATDADEWTAFLESDLTVTDADLASAITLATGSDFTKTPNWRRSVRLPLEIRLKALSAVTDKIRGGFGLNVEGAKWVHLGVASAVAVGGDTPAQIRILGMQSL